MRCPELHAWMSLRLDGLLPAAEASLFEEHVSGCPACAEKWRRWQAIGQLLDEAPLAEPAVDLTGRIMARIEAQARPRPRWVSLAIMGLELGVPLVVLGLTLVAWLCSATASSSEAMGAVAMAAGAVAHGVELASDLIGAGRLLLWATLTSPSVLIAICYTTAAAAALAAWLRVVVFRPANPPQHS